VLQLLLTVKKTVELAGMVETYELVPKPPDDGVNLRSKSVPPGFRMATVPLGAIQTSRNESAVASSEKLCPPPDTEVQLPELALQEPVPSVVPHKLIDAEEEPKSTILRQQSLPQSLQLLTALSCTGESIQSVFGFTASLCSFAILFPVCS